MGTQTLSCSPPCLLPCSSPFPWEKNSWTVPCSSIFLWVIQMEAISTMETKRGSGQNTNKTGIRRLIFTAPLETNKVVFLKSVSVLICSWNRMQFIFGFFPKSFFLLFNISRAHLDYAPDSKRVFMQRQKHTENHLLNLCTDFGHLPWACFSAFPSGWFGEFLA